MKAIALLLFLSGAEPTGAKQAAKPRVSVTNLSAGKGRAAIRKTINGELDALDGCYELALKEAPDLSGTVSLTFELSRGSTTAQNSALGRGTVENEVLGPCVLARLGAVA